MTEPLDKTPENSLFPPFMENMLTNVDKTIFLIVHELYFHVNVIPPRSYDLNALVLKSQLFGERLGGISSVSLISLTTRGPAVAVIASTLSGFIRETRDRKRRKHGRKLCAHWLIQCASSMHRSEIWGNFRRFIFCSGSNDGMTRRRKAGAVRRSGDTNRIFRRFRTM
jgi:hypothetical protein